MSFAVKSVSTADVATHRTTSMGPVTSVGSGSGAVWKTRTSGTRPERQVRRAAAVKRRSLALVKAARGHDVSRPLAAARIARVRNPGRERQDVTQRRDIAADGRHGVGRVEAIGGGRAPLARRLRAKRPVTVQIEVREARARERPLVLVAPAAAVHEPARSRAPSGSAAHHEDAERRLGIEAIVHAAEPAIEPAQVQLVEARQRRLPSELHVARI